MAPERAAKWSLVSLLVAPLAAALVLAMLALGVSPLRSGSAPEPLVGIVERALRNDATATTVQLVQPEPFSVATQSSGTLLKLRISPGESISTGDKVLVVSGKPIFAYVADAPLYRDISSGMDGSDVATAQRLLVAMGYLKRVDGVAGVQTARAIARFNADHGFASNGSVLLKSTLLWVPADSAAPTSLAVRVGDQLAPGTALYVSPSGRQSITVDVDPAPADRTLSVRGVTVALPAGQDTIITAEDVERLVDALAGQATGSASVALVDPREVGTIPSSAVVTDALQQTCYFTDLTGPPVPVDATLGTYGQVDVDASVIGSPVLMNPRSVREDLSCAS